MSKKGDKKEREQRKQRERFRRLKGRKTGHLGDDPVRQAARERLLSAVPAGTKVVRTIPGMPKMSDQLKAFIQPFEGTAKSPEHFRMLLMLGIIAWNLALLPAEKREAELGKFLTTFGGNGSQGAQTFQDIIAALVLLKETDPRFAADRRFILQYDLSDTPDGPHLEVLSALSKDDMP